MEQDRYQKSHKLFILGMISMIGSLALFTFSLYLLPNLLFGWHYNMPDFISDLKGWLQLEYDFTDPGSAKLVFLIFFIPALFFSIVAYFTSNSLDNKIYKEELDSNRKPAKPQKSRDEAIRLFLQILLLVILVFIGTSVVEWLIYTPPNPNFVYDDGHRFASE